MLCVVKTQLCLELVTFWVLMKSGGVKVDAVQTNFEIKLLHDVPLDSEVVLLHHLHTVVEFVHLFSFNLDTKWR